MEDKKSIGGLFNKKLSELDQCPSANGWNNLERELPLKKSKKTLFWGILPIILLFLGVIYVYNSEVFIKKNNRENKNPRYLNLNNQSIKDVRIDSKIINLERSKNNSTIPNKSYHDTIKNTAIKKSHLQQTDIKKAAQQLKFQQVDQNNLKIIHFKNGFKKSQVQQQDGNKNPTKKIAKNRYRRISTKKQFRLVRSTATYDEYEAIKTDRYIVSKRRRDLKIIATRSIKSDNKSSKQFYKKKKTNIKPIILAQKNIIQQENQRNNTPEQQEVQPTEEFLKSHDSVKKIINVSKNKIPRKQEKPIGDTLPVKNEDSEKNITHYLSLYYGPSNYGNHGKGNPLFLLLNNSNYELKSKTNYNYGMYARVMFNETIGIRTGIAKIATTQQITRSKNAPPFLDVLNISLNRDLSIIALQNQFIDEKEVAFTQNLSYLEVPLEAYFEYSPNKFGVAGIVGGSYLYLQKDSVYLQSSAIGPILLGSSNNISSTTFSINFQMLFTYKLGKHFQIEAGPQYKYHFKTAERTADYNPYFFNIYGGFSYKL